MYVTLERKLVFLEVTHGLAEVVEFAKRFRAIIPPYHGKRLHDGLFLSSILGLIKLTDPQKVM